MEYAVVFLARGREYIVDDALVHFAFNVD